MAKENTRRYICLKIAEDLDGLGRRFWEDLGVEEAPNPDVARAQARSRFPEGQQSGVVVAIAEGSFKPKAGGRRQVWVDDEADFDLGPALPAQQRDAAGKVPLPGQTDLDDAGVPTDGGLAKGGTVTVETPIVAGEPAHEAAPAGAPTAGGRKVKDAAPEAAEVPPAAPKDGVPTDVPPVKPIPHVVTSEEVGPTAEEVAAAKAAREDRVRENARRYAEAQAAGEAAAAPAREASAEAVAARLESEGSAKAAPATDEQGRTGEQIASDLAKGEAERKARVAAERAAAREETPAPVNAPDDGWGDPSEVGGSF